MDENKTPEQILDEIMNRTSAPAPSALPEFSQPESGPPRFDPSEPDSPEEAGLPPPQAEKKSSAGPVVRFAVLAAGLVGLAVLMLLLNARLNTLEASLEDLQLMDSLREENEMLTRDNKVLQQDKEKADKELDQTKWLLRDTERSLQDLRNDAYYQIACADAKMKQSQYLWLMEQFMNAEEYSMAAMVMVLENTCLNGTPDPWFDNWTSGKSYPTLSFIQENQYRSIQGTLLEQGYIQMTYTHAYDSTPSGAEFTEEYDLNKNEEINTLAILWCILDAYYVNDLPGAASQWLSEFEDISSFPSEDGLNQRVSKAAGTYTMQIYKRMIRELEEQKYLVETENGYERDPASSDISYYVFPDIFINYALEELNPSNTATITLD